MGLPGVNSPGRLFFAFMRRGMDKAGRRERGFPNKKTTHHRDTEAERNGVTTTKAWRNGETITKT
jgi:hypothetical protein